MALFTVTTVGGAYAIGRGSQTITKQASEQTKEDIEKKLRRDVEAARYASHSKNALALLFEEFQSEEDKENDPNAKYKKHQIKLPGVVWHPKAVQREKEREKRAAASTGDGKSGD